MKRWVSVGAALLVLLLVQATGAGSTDPATVLKAATMAAVVGPYVSPTPETGTPIRGVRGGGLPWQIDEAKVVLLADGRVTAKVEGLVLLDAAPVPEGLRGKNPITSFKAIVSCETIDTAGAAATENVSTGLFPATLSGNSKIEDTVGLPSPCFAPVVFVTSPGGQWFSVTGL
jgi:hypothetical protein